MAYTGIDNDCALLVDNHRTGPELSGKDDEPLLAEHAVSQQPTGRATVCGVLTVQRTSIVTIPLKYDKVHLVCAIISAFFCPLFGIVAIALASRGYKDFQAGDYVQYLRMRRWAIAFQVLAFKLGLIAIFVYCFILADGTSYQDTKSSTGDHYHYN